MKTIEVSDEMYDFLIDVAKKIKTQDNRGTAKPYFFQVQTKEQVAVPEGCGIEAWFYDDFTIETDDEINEKISDLKNVSIEEVKSMKDYEKELILEEAGYHKINYDYKNEYYNCFFTEDACENHIQANKHNYNQPKSYLNHAFRNHEMKKIFEFFDNLQPEENKKLK